MKQAEGFRKRNAVVGEEFRESQSDEMRWIAGNSLMVVNTEF